MTASNITSTKPYLLRAIFDWAEDNGYTPQVLVNAHAKDVEVPQAHVVDGQIVLNISSSAVQLHVMDNECLSFSARFGGVEQDIFLPIESIVAIFARENSQGIFFEEYDDGGKSESKLTSVDAPDDTSPDGTDVAATDKVKVKPKTKAKKAKKGKKPPKRDASHLKIIK